jgi:hypothetical protein
MKKLLIIIPLLVSTFAVSNNIDSNNVKLLKTAIKQETIDIQTKQAFVRLCIAHGSNDPICNTFAKYLNKLIKNGKVAVQLQLSDYMLYGEELSKIITDGVTPKREVVRLIIEDGDRIMTAL